MGMIRNFMSKRGWRGGFSIQEVMSGEHEFEPGCGPSGRYPFEFHVTWGTDKLLQWLDRSSETFLVSDLEGKVTVGGLCKEAPCKGQLELKYFGERRLRYTFDFQNDGTTYHFVGEKVNIRPWNLPVSHTTCFGVLTEKETGKLVSRSVTHFRFRSLPRFLASLRFSIHKGKDQGSIPPS